ncbi:hypothetical protein D3C77_379480 [compost metagenome]
MEISLVAGAFPKGHKGYEILLLHLSGKRNTDGMRHLRCHWTGARNDPQALGAEMAWHLPPAAVRVFRFGKCGQH